MKTAAKKFKIPTKIGECADLLYTLKAKRLQAQKALTAMAEQETLLKDHIIKKLPKSATSGVAGKLCRVSVVTEDVPKVENWDKFYDYIAKNKAFELLGKSIKKEAIEERLEAGKKIPGLGKFSVTSVSINKV